MLQATSHALHRCGLLIHNVARFVVGVLVLGKTAEPIEMPFGMSEWAQGTTAYSIY